MISTLYRMLMGVVAFVKYILSLTSLCSTYCTFVNRQKSSTSGVVPIQGLRDLSVHDGMRNSLVQGGATNALNGVTKLSPIKKLSTTSLPLTTENVVGQRVKFLVNAR